MTLEGWVPQINDYTSLREVVEFAFDYRGNTTVVKKDGAEIVGYIFNRDADTPEATAALRAAIGAVAMDMESVAIVETAAAHGCASVVVRGVSGDARGSLPKELLALVGADGRIRGGSVFALARPRVLAGALRLRRATRQALGRVAGSLARLAA